MTSARSWSRPAPGADYAHRVLAIPIRRDPPPTPTGSRTTRGRSPGARRQLALHDPERRFEILLTEAALRWPPGSVSTSGQLDRIAALSTLSSVSFGVISRRSVPNREGLA